MNLRYVVKQLGLLLLALSAVLLVLSGGYLVGGWFRPGGDGAATMALFLTGLIGAAIGGCGWFLTRRETAYLGRREALLLVAATWVFGAVMAALPYWFWAHLGATTAPEGHPFANFVNCYFESMSGLTTTGATILADIEAVPRSLLLWRAITQWLGGLGIVVIFVAVLPTLGVGGKRLFQAEAHTASPEGLQPQVRQMARVLLYIYVTLTVTQVLLLSTIGGMKPFDSVCHAFTTIATAGFSPRTASVGAYNKVAVEIIIVVFMVLSAINFGLYYALMRRRYSVVLRDPELRMYLILLVVGTTIVVLCLLNQPMELTTGETVDASAGTAVRQGVFNAVSIGTTTGYASANFNAWPFAAQAVLVMFMFIGGCAGSTAGGIKVIRFWVALKVMLAQLEQVFRPNVVRPVRVGPGVLDDRLKLGTVSYVLGIILLFAFGSFAIMLLEQLNEQTTCDYTTAAGASLACLCTIGPGLAKVGAIENYGWMTDWSKGLLTLLMVLGRLEVFAIVVLVTPRFWRGD